MYYSFYGNKYRDSNDDEYIHMLMQCPLHNQMFLKDRYEELEKFLVAIFAQEPERVYRRVRYFAAEQHEVCLRDYAKRYEHTPKLIHKLKDYWK